jgi:hypothetical protein
MRAHRARGYPEFPGSAEPGRSIRPRSGPEARAGRTRPEYSPGVWPGSPGLQNPAGVFARDLAREPGPAEPGWSIRPRSGPGAQACRTKPEYSPGVWPGSPGLQNPAGVWGSRELPGTRPEYSPKVWPEIRKAPKTNSRVTPIGLQQVLHLLDARHHATRSPRVVWPATAGQVPGTRDRQACHANKRGWDFYRCFGFSGDI